MCKKEILGLLPNIMYKAGSDFALPLPSVLAYGATEPVEWLDQYHRPVA